MSGLSTLSVEAKDNQQVIEVSSSDVLVGSGYTEEGVYYEVFKTSNSGSISPCIVDTLYIAR